MKIWYICKDVYNFLLENIHSVFLESLQCCYAFVYVSIEVINFINKSGRTHNKGV